MISGKMLLGYAAFGDREMLINLEVWAFARISPEKAKAVQNIEEVI